MSTEAAATMVHLGVGQATLCTTDAQIAAIERLVEAGHVEQLITVAVLRDVAPGIMPVQVLTMGCPPERVREILRVALEGLEHTLGLRGAS